MPEVPKKRPASIAKSTDAPIRQSDPATGDAKIKTSIKTIEETVPDFLKTIPGLRLTDFSQSSSLSRLMEKVKFASRNDNFLPHLVPSERVRELETAIAKYKAELQQQTIALETGERTRQELQAKLLEFEETQAKLKAAEQIAFILSRVSPALHESFAQRKDIQEKFFAREEQPAYVLAIDIRRSTELMLKARRPELFANFMTALCDQLKDAITRHFGVFDKFTGDGILAFFPDFFTGPDAAYHAVTAAHEASGIFRQCYREHRASFSSILTDVNLATGIDYGGVHLVRVADGLTVVGVPVVYACRFSSGPGGQVLLNQAAYEKLSSMYSQYFYISEQTLEIKHEGSVLCYNVKPGNSQLTPKSPPWLVGQSLEDQVVSDGPAPRPSTPKRTPVPPVTQKPATSETRAPSKQR